MTLKELQIGKSAVVDTVGGTGALRQHFLDMGLVPGAQVTLIKLAPMGDPMELRIHGYELTLRWMTPHRSASSPPKRSRRPPLWWTIRWWTTRVWARAASTTSKRASIPCQTAQP